MPTAPPVAPPPVAKKRDPNVVDYDQFIDKQLRQTSWQVKMVGQTTRLLILAAGLLGALLLMSVAEHWVFNAFPDVMRWAIFALILGALVWSAIRFVWPLLSRRINPAYSAQTIERNAPGLKNALLNLLFLRARSGDAPEAVIQALEKQAATGLSAAKSELTVDRTSLVRALAVFLALVVLAGLYKVVSPKDPLATAGRVLMPWADIRPSTRVKITNIEPGDATVDRGTSVTVTAVVEGARDDEDVVLLYSTPDKEFENLPIPMTPDANGYRHACTIPDDLPSGRKLGANAKRGIQGAFMYAVRAGDARTDKFRVAARDVPGIFLDRLELDYPKYTGFAPTTQTLTGDIRAIEGTRVTVHAHTNDPAERAFVEFDDNPRDRKSLSVAGEKGVDVSGAFALAMRDDRRTPEHAGYVLRFVNTFGQPNPDPIRYLIEVEPDLSPEVAILAPTEERVGVRLHESLPIEVEARDPDFALSGVVIKTRNDKTNAEAAHPLLEEPFVGKFAHGWSLSPAELNLEVGDEVTYWAVANDNREPTSNTAVSRKQRIVVLADMEPAKDGDAKPQPKDGAGEGERGEADSQPGGAEKQGDHSDESAEGQPNDESQPGERPKGGEQGRPSEGNKNNDSENRGDESRDEQQEEDRPTPQDGQQDGEQNDEQQSDGQEGGQDGGSESRPGEKGDAAEGQTGKGGAGEAKPSDQPSDGQGEPASSNNAAGQSNDSRQRPGDAKPEPVAPDGSDDGAAFERMREHFNESEGSQDNSGEQPPQDADAQANADSKPRPGKPEKQPGQGDSPTDPNAAKQDDPKSAGDANEKGEKEKQPNLANSGAERSGDNAEKQPATDDKAASDKAAGDQADDENTGDENADMKKNEDADAKPLPGEKQPCDDAQAKPNETNGDKPENGEPGKGDRDGKTEDSQADGTGAETTGGEHAGDKKESSDENEPNSPGGKQENPKGESGAGEQPGDSQGSPSQEDQPVKQRDKKQQESGDRKDDGEPPSALDQQKQKHSESDSQGDSGGDKAGGGQEGNGQRANADGTGSAGQNQAADEGAGQADESGKGETSGKPGGDKKADGETGESDGQEKGDGSKEREGAGESGKPKAESGESGKPKDDSGDEAGEKSRDAGDENSKPGEAEQPGESGEQSDKQSGDRDDKQANANDANQPGRGNASSNPAGGGKPGGVGGAEGGDPGGIDGDFAGDDANLDYAKKQTDLILDRLSNQMQEQEVDQELLDKLGWSQDDLKKFIDRWNARKAAAQGKSETATDAERELNDALRSLGLTKRRLRRDQTVGAEAAQRNLRDAYRGKTPPEFQRQIKEYSRGVAKSRDGE